MQYYQREVMRALLRVNCHSISILCHVICSLSSVPLDTSRTFSIISSELTQPPRGGTTAFRARTCVCAGATHTTAQAGIRPRIWAPKAPFSLAFHGRLTPLAVYRRRGPCRFGAPERAVSTRSEIDSGTRARACVRANGCVSVWGACVCMCTGIESQLLSRPP